MILKDGRWRESILIMLSFVGVGFQLSVIGPALPDLSHRTGNSLADFGSIFVARAIGYIVGAFVAMPSVDRIEITAMFCLCFFFNAAVVFCFVFTTQLWQICCILMFDGISMGVLDTAGNVAILRIWKKDEDGKTKTTFIHLMHSAFAFGGLMAPILARPFISEYHFNSTASISSSGCALNDEIIRDSDDRLNSLFYTLAMMLLAISMLMGLEWCFAVRRIFLTESKKQKVEKERHPLELRFEKELTILLFIFFCFYVGCEMVFQNFIYSYGVCWLRLDREDATALTGIFWLFFTIFRALSAIQARYQSPKSMLWCSMVGSFLSGSAYIFIKTRFSAYLAAAIFGASMSNSFATGFLYAEGFTHVTGKLASWFIIGGAIGWAVIPGLAGLVLETNPNTMPLIIGCCISVNAVVMVIIDKRGSQFLATFRRVKLSQLNSEESALEDS